MAKDELVGNMATEHLIQFFEEEDINHSLDKKALEAAIRYSAEVFM
jgi:hydroxymethylglutaryl-CoA lyase